MTNFPEIHQQKIAQAKKTLGQHFLFEKRYLDEMVAALSPFPGETILEVGPGTGSLTWRIAEKAQHLFAVEKDEKLFHLLEKEKKKRKCENITLIREDILHFLEHKMDTLGKSFSVIGNIPYYLTGKLLRELLARDSLPRKIVFLLQEEVAGRLSAPRLQSNLLSLSVQTYGRPRLLSKIPRTLFHPVPKVDSRIVLIENISHEFFTRHGIEEKAFFTLLKAAFGQKRKTLENSLSHGLKKKKEAVKDLLYKAGIPPRARAQELSLDNFARLTQLLYAGPETFSPHLHSSL